MGCKESNQTQNQTVYFAEACENALFAFDKLDIIGHWLDMVYLPPQGEFCRPYFSRSSMSCKDFATC